MYLFKCNFLHPTTSFVIWRRVTARLFQSIFLLVIFLPLFDIVGSPLKPVRLDNPRDTMASYLEAMEDYKRGLKSGDRSLRERVNDAARCFDLSLLPSLQQAQMGRRTAILLKEVLDRIIVIDLQRIPSETGTKKWRLKDTEITIIQIDEGPRREDFLFSADTSLRVQEFYNKVRHLPYLEGSTQGASFEEAWQKQIPSRFQKNIFGMKLWQWIGFFLSLLFGFLIKFIIELVVTFLKKIIEKKKESLRSEVIVALEKPIGLLGATTLWFISIDHLQLKGFILPLASSLVHMAFSISIIWAIYSLSNVLARRLQRLALQTESELDDQLIPLFSKAVRLAIIITGGLITAQNLGFNVVSLLAGLGIGGLAFALAAKDMAANLFGSIMILLDQPFTVGDWIVTNNVEGTVEEVGFRSTRIRTFYGSIVSIPNATLANVNIDNMGQRHYRRVKTSLGITYDTSPEKIEAFTSGIKSLIEKHPHTKKGDYHVVLNEYGDFSLNILVYVFLDVPNWEMELLERENFFLDIHRLAHKIGVEFAFPTQTIHVDSLPESKKLSL